MTPPAWLYDTDAKKQHINGQWSWFILWLIVTGIGVFILKADPNLHGTHTQLGLPKCYSVILWDRPCPGCGLTTSWTATMHGNLPLAFRANALGPIIYYLFTISALLSGFGALKKWRLRSETKLATISLATMIVLFLVYGAARFATTTYNDPGHATWKALQERGYSPSPNR